MRHKFKQGLKLVGVLALVAGVLAPMYAGHQADKAKGAFEAETQTVDTLPGFIATLMDECTVGARTPHSAAKRAVLSAQMERAANTYLEGNNRHAFIALACLETRMGTVARATSTAGAKGLMQLMPATAKAEAERCGLGTVTEADLFDNEINLTIAACHYAKLVADLGPAIAPAAFNSGSASSAVKAFQKLTPTKNVETASYAALVGILLATHLHEKAKPVKGGGNAKAESVDRGTVAKSVDSVKDGA